MKKFGIKSIINFAFFAVLFLFTSKLYSQSKLVSVKIDPNTKNYVLTYTNQVIYDQLKVWNDEEITKKYASVPGIKAFGLNREKISEIFAQISINEISLENISFLLKNYLSLTEKDIATILKTKL
jgi:hypothetical protein